LLNHKLDSKNRKIIVLKTFFERIVQYLSSEACFFHSALLLVTSLVWSRFLVAVALWALAFVALFIRWKYEKAKFSPPQYTSTLKGGAALVVNYFTQLVKKKPENAFWLATIPFFLVLVSGFWSEDFSAWLSRTRIRLPFLILPLAFLNAPPLSKRHFQTVLYVFVAVISANIAVVLVNYALNTKLIVENLGRGQHMPHMKEHITFSIMAAFAVFVGLKLWRDKFFLRFPFERYILGFLCFFLFVGIHIISVRSGILTLYALCVVFFLLEIFKKRRFLQSLFALVLFPVLLWSAYTFVPSLRIRIDYTLWDLDQYKIGNFAQNSDSERILSLKMGYAVFLKQPILGAGAGDMETELAHAYQQNHPNLEVKMPHNAWLMALMGTGAMGLIFFGMSFLGLIFFQKNYQNTLFLLFMAAAFMGHTIDYIVESMFGAVFYTFFISLFLNSFKNRKS
jgi:O-antigen ligase